MEGKKKALRARPETAAVCVLFSARCGAVMSDHSKTGCMMGSGFPRFEAKLDSSCYYFFLKDPKEEWAFSFFCAQ